MKRRSVAALALTSLLLLAPRCLLYRPEDPVLHLDPASPWFDAAEIVPFVPWVSPGLDRLVGTEDDLFLPMVQGDVDIVVRSGRTSIGGAIPPPTGAGGLGSTPIGVAEPFGQGVPIPFAVAPSDGQGPDPWGRLGVPPYWHGLPVLVLAFADLDGDGYVGVTHLDGDPLDEAIEEAEWEPVGRRFAIAAGEVAAGSLAIEVGGPAGQPVRVALAAAAWAGPTDPTYLGGNVPRGPGVTTRLPFWPDLRPERVLEGGAQGPPAASADALVGVEVRAAIAPEAGDPLFGEAFTLRLDGSDPTIDVARVVAGAPVRFGLAMRPDLETYRWLPERPLRPGAGGFGPVEVLQRLVLADDGAATAASLRVVALDRLDNPTAPGAPANVVVTSGGVVRIVSPDLDADPFRETVAVSDAAGSALVLDDGGDGFDGPDEDQLLVDGGGALARVAVFLPDPDVDDSGVVDDDDLDAIDDARGARIGDPGFSARLDLDGSGRIDRGDRDVAEASLGLSVAVP